MPLYQQPNFTGGIDEALTSTVSSVPEFTAFFLAFVFGLILLGGSTAQRKREGRSDLPLWATLAGIGTTMVALLMSLAQGLIQIEVLSVTVAVTIASGFWLFMDRNRNEI